MYCISSMPVQEVLDSVYSTFRTFPFFCLRILFNDTTQGTKVTLCVISRTSNQTKGNRSHEENAHASACRSNQSWLTRTRERL
jgi:hypothetical protein